MLWLIQYRYVSRLPCCGKALSAFFASASYCSPCVPFGSWNSWRPCGSLCELSCVLKDHGKFWVLKQRFHGFTCLFNKMVVGEFDYMDLSLYKGMVWWWFKHKGGCATLFVCILYYITTALYIMLMYVVFYSVMIMWLYLIILDDIILYPMFLLNIYIYVLQYYIIVYCIIISHIHTDHYLLPWGTRGWYSISSIPVAGHVPLIHLIWDHWKIVNHPVNHSKHLHPEKGSKIPRQDDIAKN